MSDVYIAAQTEWLSTYALCDRREISATNYVVLIMQGTIEILVTPKRGPVGIMYLSLDTRLVDCSMDMLPDEIECVEILSVNYEPAVTAR